MQRLWQRVATEFSPRITFHGSSPHCVVSVPNLFLYPRLLEVFPTDDARRHNMSTNQLLHASISFCSAERA